MVTYSPEELRKKKPSAPSDLAGTGQGAIFDILGSGPLAPTGIDPRIAALNKQLQGQMDAQRSAEGLPAMQRAVRNGGTATGLFPQVGAAPNLTAGTPQLPFGGGLLGQGQQGGMPRIAPMSAMVSTQPGIFNAPGVAQGNQDTAAQIRALFGGKTQAPGAPLGQRTSLTQQAVQYGRANTGNPTEDDGPNTQGNFTNPRDNATQDDINQSFRNAGVQGGLSPDQINRFTEKSESPPAFGDLTQFDLDEYRTLASEGKLDAKKLNRVRAAGSQQRAAIYADVDAKIQDILTRYPHTGVNGPQDAANSVIREALIGRLQTELDERIQQVNDFEDEMVSLNETQRVAVEKKTAQAAQQSALFGVLSGIFKDFDFSALKGLEGLDQDSILALVSLLMQEQNRKNAPPRVNRTVFQRPFEVGA